MGSGGGGGAATQTVRSVVSFKNVNFVPLYAARLSKFYVQLNCTVYMHGTWGIGSYFCIYTHQPHCVTYASSSEGKS